MTPGEFEDLVAGGIEREREAKLNAALVASTIIKANGGPWVPPQALVDPDAEYGATPFDRGDSPETKYAREMERRRKSLDRKWRRWCREQGVDPT